MDKKMDIYKHKGTDCSNFGISNKFDEVLIWKYFDKNAPENAVVIIEDKCCGEYRIRAEPANSKGKNTMFGGNCIHTSNGLVPHSGKFIQLHDRIEQWSK